MELNISMLLLNSDFLLDAIISRLELIPPHIEKKKLIIYTIKTNDSNIKSRLFQPESCVYSRDSFLLPLSLLKKTE